MMKSASLYRIFAVLAVSSLVFACDEQDPNALVVECVDPGDTVPAGEWVCGEDNTVECTSRDKTVVHTIYAQLETGSCDDAKLTVSTPGPFALGTHEITVEVTAPEEDEVVLCTSTLTIVDTTGPVMEPKTTELWPPNHKFHTVTIEDCVDVVDRCDPDVEVVFTSAASDEPRNSTGDGNTEVDILNLGCDSVELLAERKGNGDARVYTLGVRAVDASGNVTEGACHVIVPHDQGGKVPVDSGIAYQEDAPACN
jgi:hypothetical protein